MPIQILVPELGESVVQATVGHWLKQAGEHVQAGENVVELETDKVNLEIAAPGEGLLSRIERKEGEDVRAGDVLAVIEPEREPVTQSQPGKPSFEPAQPPERVEKQTSGNGDRITPVAARFAQEQGVDLAAVQGTGPGGRVTKQDIQDFVRKERRKPAPPSERAPSPRLEPSTVSQPTLTASVGMIRSEREERIRMTRRRRTIAERLLQVSQTTAMLTTFNEVDMSRVVDMRKRHREEFQERFGVSLGFSAFFVKALIGALKPFPQLNSEIQGDEIVVKHYYDIGIAVGASEGLVVPVLREADRMSFGEIEKRIKELAQKAENGTLSIDDLRGGTFTITNGGVFGSLLSTPILNPPQVGILGLHKVEDRPVAIEGQVVIRPMMYVALSYDHRVVDGREAVQFLVRVKQLVQDPESLLLEG